MNFNLIEDEEGQISGIYVEGFVNKEVLIDFYKKEAKELLVESGFSADLADFTTEDAKYQWCILATEEDCLTFSDKAETGSFGVTVIYW